MKSAFRVLLCLLLLSLGAPFAAAQPPAGPANVVCAHQESVGNNYLKCTGHFEFEQGDVKLYADEAEWFKDQDRILAAGNVVFSQGRNQIAADRSDFNSKTRFGTFYTATGIATMQTQRQAALTPGAFVAPQLTGEDTYVIFFGETVEKTGAKSYKITNGGFTTCLQPTPRWDFHAGTINLNVGDYTLLLNTVLHVKGVPVFYLPVVYYPTNEEGRATGFLLPTYGSTTLRGQEIHNWFFWAINRSQDATIEHGYYSKFGHLLGGEYRYARDNGDAIVKTYMMNRRETALSTGTTLPAERSYRTIVTANQALNRHLRARADVSYFSSLSTNQTFYSDIAALSRSDRTYGGNIVGSWKNYSVNGTFRRTDIFSDAAHSSVVGSSPLVSVSKNEHPLFAASPLYYSFSGEYARIERQTKADGLITDDRSLSRLDFSPSIRYPFKRWQWLTVNSALSWRETLYTRSVDPATGLIVDDNLNRQLITFQANAIGPVFNRVWDTPGSGYAEKFKHTIEPTLMFERTALIGDFNRTVTGVENPIIGTTRYTYGLNNRFFAKRKLGQVSQAQEIASVSLSQTYYTQTLAAQFDPNYQTSSTGQPSHLSPIRLDVRVTPVTNFSSGMQAEFDTKYRALRSLSATARYTWIGGTTDVRWTQQKDVTNSGPSQQVSRLLTIGSNPHTPNNRYGGTYRLTFDAARSTILQQSAESYYNAQCCGVSFQYARTTSYAGVLTTIPADHKFLFSFSLAGLGSFSPFDGGLGGVPR